MYCIVQPLTMTDSITIVIFFNLCFLFIFNGYVADHDVVVDVFPVLQGHGWALPRPCPAWVFSSTLFRREQDSSSSTGNTERKGGCFMGPPSLGF